MIYCLECDKEITEGYFYLEKESLCILIQKYCSNDFPSLRLKNEIILRIYDLDEKFLLFLKDIDVSYYMRAISLKGVKISNEYIHQLYSLISDKNKYYFIWNLGLTGNWGQTTKYLELIERQ